MTTHHLEIPISEPAIRALHAGDTALLSGVLVTGRDVAHKYLHETFLSGGEVPEAERALHGELRRLLHEGVLYHCGPIVRRDEEGKWQFVASGPTTSIRQEMYMPAIIAHFSLRAVVGKGGMGDDTLRACQEQGAVYLHAIGGAASLIAAAVKEVLEVHKLDAFSAPEAFWVVRVEGFPAVVTMDSHGRSIHAEVDGASQKILDRLLGRPS